MKSILRKYTPGLFRFFKKLKFSFILVKKGSYVYDSGYLESHLTNTPVDKNSNPIPWMNYAVIGLLKERLKKAHSVFEFGSGYSTCFFAEHCGSVTSLEYDPNWVNHVKGMIAGYKHANLLFHEVNDDYPAQAANTGRQFDLIVVDGRMRVECVKQSVNSLNPHGVLLLDDSERVRYQEAFDFMDSCGYKHLSLEGLKPGAFPGAKTTLFYRQENCLGI